MELDVVYRDAFVVFLTLAPSRLVLHQQFVVHAELALWHSTQLGLDLDGPLDVVLEDGALVRQEDVDVLDHVQVDLVLLVTHIVRSPADGPGGLGGELFEFLEVVLEFDLHAALLDELLEQFGVGHLGDAVVHDLIQQFVDEDEVFLDEGLFDILAAEVGLTDIDDLVEELDGHGGGDIGFGGGQDDDVLLLDMDEGGAVDVDDGRLLVLLGRDLLGTELDGLETGDVVLVHPVDQDLALLVDEHD